MDKEFLTDRIFYYDVAVYIYANTVNFGIDKTYVFNYVYGVREKYKHVLNELVMKMFFKGGRHETTFLWNVSAHYKK